MKRNSFRSRCMASISRLNVRTMFVFTLMVAAFAQFGTAGEKNFHSFTVKAIDGKEVNLSAFEGKKVLVVNVASKCGLTPQYEKLQALYEQYKDKDFVIIGFPANNFGAQEPGTNEEILTFCTSTYNVTFPMMSKISVKGEDIDPLYEWLTQEALNGKQDAPVSWNFQKFMIDSKGDWAGFVEPRTDPFAEEIVKWIEENE
ncbi:Hydroperoxy fatty acid reductase gpx1 [termite gut metagenome]|uniref:Hydroperoxy fatty acid reductase gpx1 n=1 Tax=termite gut metagenome TaxID=433724 RepID=A0A5J4QX50_9ZZZZ